LAQDPALSSAKSFQVDETLGKAHLTVQVIRPDKIKVVLSNNNGLNGLFVGDAQGGHEFNEKSNTWVTVEKHVNGIYGSVLLDLAAVDILMNGGRLPVMPGFEITTAHESYNGRDAVVTTQLGKPETGSDGTTYQRELKLWSDESTGLPLRRAQAVISKGEEHIFQDLTFDDVKLNPKLDIRWKAPAGSREDPGFVFLAPGKLAPNFTLKDTAGKDVNLSDFRGKVVVLDFWATWCGPCQRAMPHLQEVYEQVKDKNVVVLGVCVWDEKGAYDKWVDAKKATYTFETLFDPAGRGAESVASKLYAVKAIPTQYVIDRDGKIVAGYIPGAAKDDPLMKALRKAGVSANP
jgi:peroxiredoxin